MNILRPIAAVSLSFSCALGCSSGARSPSARADDALTGTTLTCSSLTFTAGHGGSGQTAAALATRQLSGTQDVWDDYVEFSPGASATCVYSLPAGTAPSSLESLSLVTNYRGPAATDMRWTFEAWDYAAGAWVALGDNGFAADWTWSAATLPLPAPAARFASPTGDLQIRYAATSAYDASDLDQLVLVATTGASSPGDDAGATDSDAGDTGSAADAGADSGTTTTDAGATNGSIWQPAPGTSWQWQLSGTVDTSLAVQMYDIDLFENAASVIAGLRARGIAVICYLSAGSYENWRPDANQFPASVIGKGLQGWPGEWWLDVRASAVRTIMLARMDLAVQKGCTGIEPDNVDGYANDTGFPLTAADQLDYNRFLATSAHARGLSIALKNDPDQAGDLVSSFDFELDEQCFQYSECDKLAPFIAAGKAVFEVEYGTSSLVSSVCPQANAANFDTLIKNLSLDPFRISCR